MALTFRAMGPVVCILLLFWVLPLRMLEGSAVWLIPTVLLLSIVVFSLELFPALIRKPKRAEQGKLLASALVVLLTGIQMIIDFRVDQFDPIASAQGTISLAFSRVLAANEIGLPAGTHLYVTKGRLTNQQMHGIFSIRSFQSYIPPPMTTPGQLGEKRWTQAHIEFDSSPGISSNGLDQLSSNSFIQDLDYVVLRGLHAPSGVSVVGTLVLTLNGTKRLVLNIPEHHFSNDKSIFIPLNDHAKALLIEYRMFNPKSGSKDTALP